MFSIALNYLNGWAMAAVDGARKEQAEWPPHPDRVFMAMAAAWFETGEDPAEGAALRWLEQLPSPALMADEEVQRSLTTHFVPVNDAKVGSAVPKSPALDKLKDAGLSVLAEYRSRQPRSFPTVIPKEPLVHLVWLDQSPDVHRAALEGLLDKVTHVGHSASLVQCWLEDQPPTPNWWPQEAAVSDGKVAGRRMRVPVPGRLETLKQRLNREAWIEYHDLVEAIAQSKARSKVTYPPRVDWEAFPDAVFLATESAVKQHPHYVEAKSGVTRSAIALVDDLVNEQAQADFSEFLSKVRQEQSPILVSAHAYERSGVNAIPAVLTKKLAAVSDLPYEDEVVQTNVVSYTGSNGYGRMARQAMFSGPVERGRDYILVDDFIGQGGTIANLRGYIAKKGGRVLGTIALTGKPDSAKLCLTTEQLDELRQTHGKELETWWKEHFGHPFSRLTQSEARYLARSPDVDTIRNKIAQAKQAGGDGSGGRSLRQEKAHLAELQQQLLERFPEGCPSSLRPEPARWQAYTNQKDQTPVEPQGTVFESQLLIFRLTGRRPGLSSTLRLTKALRGALLKHCPVTPQPEWFSGHEPDGRPSKDPHLAVMPLPFVDAEHADGRVMGLALALPEQVPAQSVADCLEGFFLDEETGQPKSHRLFDGQWFECGLEMELTEKPPVSLQNQVWTGASRCWATVTPVVFDRHFNGKDRWTKSEESVKDACERIGLPRPLEVVLHPVSPIRGVPHARQFPAWARRNSRGQHFHTHVTLVFEEEVSGPVIIGAGRFRGYGLCRPLPEERVTIQPDEADHDKDVSNG